MLTLKQLSQCQPRVSPSPKKSLSAYSFLLQLSLNPITPFCPQNLRTLLQKSSPAALKCAVVYCFHIKPWMEGRDIQQCPAESQTVSVLLFFQDVFSAWQYRINIGKYRQFFGNFLWHDSEILSETAHMASIPGLAPITCNPSASGCRQNRCGRWHICLVSEWSCHLHMKEEERRSSHSLSGHQPNMLHGDRHTQY